MNTCTCPNCGKTIEVPDAAKDTIFCKYCGTKIPVTVHVNINYSYTKHEETTTHTEHIVDEAKVRSADNVSRVINLFAEPIERKRAQDKYYQEKAMGLHEPEKTPEQQALEDEAEAIVFAEQEKMRAERAEARKQAAGSFAEKCKQNPKQTLLILAAVLVILIGSTVTITNAVRTHVQNASHAAELDRLHAEGEAAVHQSMGEALLPKDGYTGDYRVLDKALRDAGFTDITLIPAKDLIIGYTSDENDIMEVTVDGSPQFDKNTWVSADTPITIKYHSFITSSDTTMSSKAKAEKDALSKKVQDTVDTAKLKVQDAAATAASQALDSILDSLK